MNIKMLSERLQYSLERREEMAKEAGIFVRVDPTIKKQSEEVLGKLGLSMATAIEIYLRQVVRQGKIPFEVSLDYQPPIYLDSLTDEQLEKLVEHSMKQAENGEGYTQEEFDKMLKEEFGI